jgi:sugar phosphate isomerase/epimerase
MFKKIFRRPFKSRGDKLLLQVKRLILEEPRRINMDVPQYVEGANNGTMSTTDYPPCGTVGCIAGWADVAAKGGVDISLRSRMWRGVEVRARKLLNLSKNEADKLFFVHYWPSNFYWRYRQAVNPIERAEITAERIDHFIKTRQ